MIRLFEFLMSEIKELIEDYSRGYEVSYRRIVERVIDELERLI